MLISWPGCSKSAPDPVRAQLVAEQVVSHNQQGQEPLAAQRGAVLLAATTLRDWAIGATERQAAETALSQAIYLLEEAGIQ